MFVQVYRLTVLSYKLAATDRVLRKVSILQQPEIARIKVQPGLNPTNQNRGNPAGRHRIHRVAHNIAQQGVSGCRGVISGGETVIQITGGNRPQ